MFVTNWISPTKIQKISEITNFFRHYFLSRTEVLYVPFEGGAKSMCIILCVYQIVDFGFQILFPFTIHHTASRKFRIELYQLK